MSETAAIDEAHEAGGEEAHTYPSDRGYVMIGLFLAVLTGAEISTYSFGLHGAAVVVVLLVLMCVKFGVVAALFMHLRFDSRVFRRFFITGITLALFVYMVVLVTLHAFD